MIFPAKSIQFSILMADELVTLAYFQSIQAGTYFRNTPGPDAVIVRKQTPIAAPTTDLIKLALQLNQHVGSIQDDTIKNPARQERLHPPNGRPRYQ